MARPRIHEDRKQYRREWQREYYKRMNGNKRYKNFKTLVDDVLEYEKQGLTYSEIAQELANDYKYKLSVKEK